MAEPTTSFWAEKLPWLITSEQQSQTQIFTMTRASAATFWVLRPLSRVLRRGWL